MDAAVLVWCDCLHCFVYTNTASAPVFWDSINQYNARALKVYFGIYWYHTDINNCKSFVLRRLNLIIPSNYVLNQEVYFVKLYAWVWYTLLMFIQCGTKFSAKRTKFFQKCILPVFLQRVPYVMLMIESSWLSTKFLIVHFCLWYRWS